MLQGFAKLWSMAQLVSPQAEAGWQSNLMRSGSFAQDCNARLSLRTELVADWKARAGEAHGFRTRPENVE